MRETVWFWARTVLALALALVFAGGGLVGPAGARAQSGLLVEHSDEQDSAASEAPDTLSVSASVSPGGMAVPDEAQVFLTLANSATDPISDIQICKMDGTVLMDVGVLSGAQSSYVFTETVTPSYSQLRDGGIRYVVRYTLGKDGSDPTACTQKVLAPIVKLKAEPSLEFTRKLSSNYAQPGEQVTVTYRVKNTGNVALTNITLKDPIVGDVGQLDELGPGKKEVFVQDITFEATVDSKPTVSYSHVNASERKKETLDSLTIYQADEWLELHLDADETTVAPGDMVTLRLRLINRGNVAYDKLEVSDQLLGPLGTVRELRPGEELLFDKRVTLKSTSTFAFSVHAKNANGGTVTSSSNMLTVAVTPAVGDVRLSIYATPDNDLLEAPGYVTFNITIKNDGQLDIRNVKLMEQLSGEITTLAVVPPRETSVPWQYHLEEGRSFVFVAEVTDADGGRLSMRSTPIEVAIGPGGAAALLPDATESARILEGGGALRLDEQGDTFTRMMTGALAVLFVLVLGFVTGGCVRLIQRRKLKRQQIQRLRRGRRNARMDQITRGEPPIGGNTDVYKRADLGL